MTISPIQPNYVTKEKFSEFKSYVSHGFDKTNEHIDNLEKHMDRKFLEVKSDFSEIKSGFLGMKSDIEDLSKVVHKIAAKIL